MSRKKRQQKERAEWEQKEKEMFTLQLTYHRSNGAMRIEAAKLESQRSPMQGVR